MTPSAPRVLLPSETMQLDRLTEDRLVGFAIERLDHHRQAMGWSGEGAFERGSWLWKRHIATRMWEQDYSHRRQELQLFERVNLSLNMVWQFIEQHMARMTRDLFNGEAFFGIVPEGPEDQHEVLKDVERWLHHRSKEAGLQQSFKTNGLLAALIRGEAVSKTTLKVTRKQETRKARPMIAGGEVQRDSTGGIITDADGWEPDHTNPARQVLKRDRRVSLPADFNPQYAERAIELPVLVSETRGADVSFPYWGDFVAPTNAVHLDNAELLAHCVQMAAPDLLDTLPSTVVESEAGRAYLAAILHRGIEESGEGAEQRQVKENRGETDIVREAAQSMGYRERRYDEIYLRVDWRGTGRFDRVAMLIDREQRWPIYYGPVSEILHWTDRPHPFRVARIFAYEDRWYGRGYFERYGLQAEFADKCWCRMELELQRSGNILVENRDAHEGGRAGRPIRFRSPETLQVVGTNTVEDVLKVITVTPQIIEVQAAMDTTLQKLQSEAGVIGPGDSTTDALNGSDTLGEAQIAEANKSVALEEREGELTPGFNEMLRDFAEIELDMDGLDVVQLAKLLEVTALADMTPLPQVIPIKGGHAPGAGAPPAPGQEAAAAPLPMAPTTEVAPPVPVEPPLTGQDRAERMIAWVAQNGDSLLKVVRIFVTRSRQGQLFAQSSKVLQVLDKWLMLPPEVRRAQRAVYADMLRALDQQNPDALLGPDAAPGSVPPPVEAAAPPPIE